MIGHKGSIIQAIAVETGTRIFVDKSTWNGGNVAVRIEGYPKQIDDAFKACHRVVETSNRFSPARKAEVTAMNFRNGSLRKVPRTGRGLAQKVTDVSNPKQMSGTQDNTPAMEGLVDHSDDGDQKQFPLTDKPPPLHGTVATESESKVTKGSVDQKKPIAHSLGLDSKGTSLSSADVPATHDETMSKIDGGEKSVPTSMLVENVCIDEKETSANASSSVSQILSSSSGFTRSLSPSHKHERTSSLQKENDLLVFLRRQADYLKSSPEHFFSILKLYGVVSISDLKHAVNEEFFESIMKDEFVKTFKWATFKSVVSFESVSPHKWNLECPLSSKLMVDPVLASDGFTYERSAIESWFSKYDYDLGKVISPKTNSPMLNLILIPNDELREMVRKDRESSS
jgi:hypothetical protein